ncbi:MAG TPA: DUF5333 family protein [Albidovulum sp.]|uniref:DUF5333 family protein n=1 Tax=Albidovulum sp. TaxID=1872424 RepID=UPI002CA04526|nr:DUF5333 family protein [Albidovulum sp.]
MTAIAKISGIVRRTILVAALAAAAPAIAQDGTAKVPKEVVDFGIDLGLADQIAKNCRRGFRVNRPYEKAWVRTFEKKYGSSPAWMELELDQVISQREAQDVAIAYIQRRDIVVTDGKTWCAAGKAEVAEKTRIGKLLIAR